MTTKQDRGAGPGSNHAAQAARGFFQQVHHTGLLRSAAAASDVATAVLCTLMLAVSRGEARSFVAALPPTLRELLHVSAFERRAAAEVVGREQILKAIADRLRIELDGAEFVTRIVLAAAQTWFPRKELELLRVQLPRELGDLWTPLRVSPLQA